MSFRTVASVSFLAFGLAACSPHLQSANIQKYRQLPTEERVELNKKAEIAPAGLSTVQYKELGETARHRTLATFIKKVWGESCDVSNVGAAGYSPAGSSQWRVKCRNTPNRYDYMVAIPERASSPARVLQCHSPRANVTECSVLGRPASAGQ